MNKQIIKQHAKYIGERVVLTIFTLLFFTGLIGSIATGFNHLGSAPEKNLSGKQQQLDSNLINKKPTSRWRLNSNGYSQRYINLTGTDRVERMKQLLTAYDWDAEELYPTIKAIGILNNVYPEVVICIAYADSSLGKHLKTKNNVGNVGNNDRGDTQEMKSIERGFEAIANTLENKYLSYIYTVDYLSRYHNKEGKVYATSPENWHINLTNCLGMIRNERIPDNFAFRF